MKGKRGSVLGFVIMVMMVLMILVTAALSLAASSAMGSQRRHQQAQAELTAETMAEALALEFENSLGSNPVCSLIVETAVQEKDIIIPLDGLDPEMGTVTWRLQHDAEEALIRIVVCVELGGITRETAVVLKAGSGDDSENSGMNAAGSWEVLRFEDGSGREEELR